MHGWNHWGRHYWGHGWNNWGHGYGYWAGPVFWPFFYGDMLTYALWPYDDYNSFFYYGPDFLLTSIFWPGPVLCPLYGYCPYYAYDYYGPYDGYYGYNDYALFDVYDYPPAALEYTAYHHGRRHHHHRRHARHHGPSRAVPVNVAETCGGLAPGVTQLPVDRIKRTIHATEAQVKMLDDVQTASNKANTILRASCPASVPLTPVGRLDAVANRLHAMIQAVDTLRGPLTTFYDSLDHRQKIRLASSARHGRKQGANVAVAQAPARDLAALCKKQAQSFTLLPVKRIDDIVKPEGDQKTAFEALKTASTAAATDLNASCPSSTPETMAGRLDAMTARLHALEDAANKVKPALTTFYASLSDEQKARFNLIGSMKAPPPHAENKTGTGP